jgi:hypothetical protein
MFGIKAVILLLIVVLIYTITMKDSRFCFVLFLVLAIHDDQTDYNKADEKKKKWGWKGFYLESKTR